MNNAEALALLDREIQAYRGETYAQLADRIPDGDVHSDVVGESGVSYQVEITFLWESVPEGNVLVIGSIDDGGWRAFAPLSRSFIKAPDGTCVGEPA
jgi:hypothetical protein